MHRSPSTPPVCCTSCSRVAQELLGHADLTTTMRYAHVEAHDLKHGIARLETFVARHSPEEPPPDSGARTLESSRKKVA